MEHGQAWVLSSPQLPVPFQMTPFLCPYLGQDEEDTGQRNVPAGLKGM